MPFSKFRDKWQVTHWSETWENKFKAYLFRRGLSRAFFHSPGKYPIWRDLFTKSVNIGPRESRHIFKSHVGIGSLLHCLFGDCLICFLTSFCDKGWKERNISSYFTWSTVRFLEISSVMLNVVTFEIWCLPKNISLAQFVCEAHFQ